MGAIKYYFNGSPYEVLEVVNMMNYKINVKGVVNTYPANMFKLYVERQNVTSCRSAANDMHSNVKSKDHRDPTVHRVIVNTVTLNNVRFGDVTRGDVTSVKDSPSQVWRNIYLDQAYTVFLDVVLLLIPMCLRTGAYARIMSKLCTGIRNKQGKQLFTDARLHCRLRL